MFEPNEDAEVKVSKNIKGRSAVIIDNFYKNPDEIRELALSLKYSDESDLIGGFPGMRGSLDTLEVKEKLYETYLNLCSNKSIWKNADYHRNPPWYHSSVAKGERFFNENLFSRNWDQVGFLVNVLNDTTLKKFPVGIIPHQDFWEADPHHDGCPEFQFGSVIYLNTQDECAGGTNLYSHKDEMSIPDDWLPEWMIEDAKFKYIKSKVNGNNPYTVEFEAEMKYNRMFLYQADVLHSQNVELGMFTDYNRINQIFFM